MFWGADGFTTSARFNGHVIGTKRGYFWTPLPNTLILSFALPATAGYKS